VPGNRVLLRGGNSIGMALAWLAVVKAGGIAVATMPLLRARELGDIIDKAQPTLACATRSCWKNWSSRAASGRCCAPSCPSTRPTSPARWRCGRRRRTATSKPAPPRRRHRDAGLHLRHHRQAQGRRAHPPRRAGRLRSLAAPRAARHAGRHRGRQPAAGLHLRPRRPAGVPDVGRRVGLLSRGAVHARVAGAHDQRGRRHHLLHRAHLLPPGRALRARAGRRQAAHQRQRRRRPARRDAPAVEAGQRHRDAGRHRRHRDVPHLHLVGRRGRAARRHRQGGAGLQREGGGRRGQGSAARHDRQAGRDRAHRLQVPGRRRARRTT
jgi:hypothetical protein